MSIENYNPKREPVTAVSWIRGPVVAHEAQYPSGSVLDRNRCAQAKLIYAATGMVQVETSMGLWLLSPQRAAWIAVDTDHEVRVSADACIRTLLIDSTASASLPTRCCIIEVSPLQRELTLRAVTLNEQQQGLDDSLVRLILNEIRTVSAAPLQIALPRDPRALRVCRALMKNPADTRTCSEWGVAVGASARTLQRLFRTETGMSFGAWRQQARLLEALNRLAARAPVSNVASDLGYQSPSAFSAMFKRIFGRAPRQYFDHHDFAPSTGS